MTGTSISSSGAPAGGVRQKVVTGLVWLLVQNAGLKLITLAIFTVFARILDPSDLGAFAFVTTVLGLAGIVVDQGLSEAVVQRREIWPSQLDALFVINLGIAVALTLGYARRVARTRFIRLAGRVAALGYAVPGTVLAIGLLIPLAGIDNYVDGFMRSTFGVSTGLLLSGSLFAITLAYMIRFLAVALAPIGAGLDRVSPNLDAAARTLGESALSSLWRVHLPLLMAPLGAAALLVFVDCMKELPATLLLRPFNFETLATHVYSLASMEQLEQASLGALTIVLAGLVPVLLLHEAIAGGRPGASQR